MTTLKEQIAADALNVFLNPDEFGEDEGTVIYKPHQGTAKSIKALFDEIDAAVEDFPDGRAVVRRGELTIATDATEGVAAPSLQDKVTIRGRDWAIESVPTDDGTGLRTLRVVRSEPLEKTTDGQRMTR